MATQKPKKPGKEAKSARDSERMGSEKKAHPGQLKQSEKQQQPKHRS